MCGIVGYIGKRDAVKVLLDGLTRLEYRGYDSAGVAVQNGRGIASQKLSGRVAALRQRLDREPLRGTSGIAHTRWATHGAPTTTNAHPHADCTGHIAVVHNGIVENGDVLRARLECAGHRFASDTDTELIAHLIEEGDGVLENRVVAALAQVTGTYGVAVMCADEPDKIVVARQGSPVLLGVGENEYLVASDAAAVIEHTRSVVYLNDGDVAVLTPEGYRVLDREEREQARSVVAIDWEIEAIELGGYPHFMLKEIHEQPHTVASTLRGRMLTDEGDARLNGLNLSEDEAKAFRRVVLLGCGTSWHAGLVGRFVLEELARLPVDVEYASEFRYRPRVSLDDALVIAISQSGETADTLEAMRAAREAGAHVVGLVNVVGSTIAREADGGVYLHAGPEIGVASTKAFTSQIAGLLLIGLYLGRRRGLPAAVGRALVRELQRLPAWVAEALELEDEIKVLAEQLVHSEHALYLGRLINFPVALEGALKLKEISYVHAEGYPAAEMKHGPIALVDQDMPVVFVAPDDDVYAKIVSNMQEVKARGGRVISITTIGNGHAGPADHVLRVPHVPPILSAIVTVIPLQLLAYHIAVLRGCDVDRPRNLAKSVTVE
jgi:glucosamine--fructose-6-phosphate aminotransferase (isomerizing)